MRPGLVAGLVLTGVFLLGGVVGAALSVAWLKRDEASLNHRGDRHRPQVDALTRELSLDRAQRDQLRELLKQRHREREESIRDMVRTCGTRFLAERDAENASVRALLTPAQQTRFDALVKQRREHWLGPQGDSSAAPSSSTHR